MVDGENGDRVLVDLPADRLRSPHHSIPVQEAVDLNVNQGTVESAPGAPIQNPGCLG